MEKHTPDTPRLRFDGNVLSGRIRPSIPTKPMPSRQSQVVKPVPRRRWEGVQRPTVFVNTPTPQTHLSSQTPATLSDQPAQVASAPRPMLLQQSITPNAPSSPIPARQAHKKQTLPLRDLICRCWKYYKILGLTSVISAVLVTLGITGYTLLHTVAKPIPSIITNSVSFGIMLPSNTQYFKLDPKSYSYNNRTGVLSFAGNDNNGTKINFNEQATPKSFTDGPQVYDKLITSLHPYSTFNNTNGMVVELTRPQQLQGAQAAVLNSKGTLLFARPTSDLSIETWRQIFNALQITK